MFKFQFSGNVASLIETLDSFPEHIRTSLSLEVSGTQTGPVLSLIERATVAARVELDRFPADPNRGVKIQAIKAVRTVTNWDLVKAKEFVESLPGCPPAFDLSSNS